MSVETVAHRGSVAARQFRERSKAARREVFVLVPAVAGVLFVDTQRKHLFGVDTPVRIACSFVLIALG